MWCPNCVAPGHIRRCWPGFWTWLEEDLHVCAVTIGEIQAGIEITREQDAMKAAELDEWLGRVLETYQVLAVDAAAFREWARLMHRRSDTLLQDAMIAAVAVVPPAHRGYPQCSRLHKSLIRAIYRTFMMSRDKPVRPVWRGSRRRKTS